MTPHYPMNWKTSLLDDVCVRGSGHTPSKKHPEYWDGGIKWVSLADCDSLDRVFIADTKKNISELGLQNSSARMHAKGTVVLSRDAGVGKSAILADDMAVSQHFIAWECESKGIIDHKFLYQWLQHNKRRFEIVACGSTIPTIGMPYFSCLEISYPPIEQQRAISQLLTELDCICLATEQLLLLKERRRQALAQRLLTGKARLPGFTRDWQPAELGALFKERREAGREDLPLLAITGDRGIVNREELAKRDTSCEDKRRYLRIAPGDIGYNTMRMWQGVCALSKLEGIVSPAYTICTPRHGVSAEFMVQLFQLPATIHLFHRHSQGLVDDTLNLKFKHFARIKLAVPTEVKEQQAIAAILNDADREIALHRAELDALKRQKRGLMQQLLTGKVRVP